MIYPKSYEEIAEYVKRGKNIFFFTAGWCGDCNFIKPRMPEIEVEYPDYTFIEIDRDKFIDLAIQWNIFGIPSFVIVDNGKELGRLVNKNRKTKEEITTFIDSVK
ncbi:MAG: thioredoxin family protein [Lactobacillales bacterium]|nr:thioredoxin family protein [Lactobacillales bacterium]